MAWIELHQSLPTHKKTLVLADLLGVPTVYVVGHVTTLWLWCIDNAPEGRLDRIANRTIARAAQWEGDPDTLVEALVQAGFIDRDASGALLVHDWYSYFGKMEDRRAANAQRMRERRAMHVQATCSTRVGLPDLTGPDLTKPNRTGISAVADAPAAGKPKADAPPIRPKAHGEQYAALCQVDGIGPGAELPETAHKILSRRAKECDQVHWTGKAILKIAELWSIAHPDIPATSAIVVKHGASLLAHPPRGPCVPANGRANGRAPSTWQPVETPARPNILHADGTITDADGKLIGREGDALN